MEHCVVQPGHKRQARFRLDQLMARLTCDVCLSQSIHITGRSIKMASPYSRGRFLLHADCQSKPAFSCMDACVLAARYQSKPASSCMHAAVCLSKTPPSPQLLPHAFIRLSSLLQDCSVCSPLAGLHACMDGQEGSQNRPIPPNITALHLRLLIKILTSMTVVLTELSIKYTFLLSLSLYSLLKYCKAGRGTVGQGGAGGSGGMKGGGRLFGHCKQFTVHLAQFWTRKTV